MNVKELKALIADLPDGMDVMVEQTDDESRYNMCQRAQVRDVTFGAPEIPRKQWAKVTCLVISDEY